MAILTDLARQIHDRRESGRPPLTELVIEENEVDELAVAFKDGYAYTEETVAKIADDIRAGRSYFMDIPVRTSSAAIADAAEH